MLKNTPKINTGHQKTVVIIVGPSGSGKSAVQRQLQKQGYRPMISTTTREMRVEEKDGVDYKFRKPSVFNDMLEKGLFIEHVEFSGKQYGLEKSEVDKEPGSVSVIVEPNGACEIIDYCNSRDDLDYFLVFINVSKEMQIKNMKKRGDSKESILTRLEADSIAKDFERLGLSQIADLRLQCDEHTISSMTEAILIGLLFKEEVKNGR